jgi:polyhydroxybutyrate depolymerase
MLQGTVTLAAISATGDAFSLRIGTEPNRITVVGIDGGSNSPERRPDRSTIGDTGALLSKQFITAGDANRAYLVAEPPPGSPVAAVLMSLHGTSSTAARQALLSGFEQLVQTARAVVIFPQAIVPIRAGYEWDPSQDVVYIARLATEILGRHQTPHGRVILTGMSGGARMSSLFANVHPELVQALGAVAGLRSPSVPVNRPVPILSFHGTKDRINPYGGSGTQRWNESVPDAARAWALANGITDPPSEVAVSPTLTRTTWGAEGQQGEVTLWTSRGAGHTWPGGHLGLMLGLTLGRTSKEIDATRSIWEFGLRHAGDP